jgi:hypothetical protein
MGINRLNSFIHLKKLSFSSIHNDKQGLLLILYLYKEHKVSKEYNKPMKGWDELWNL